MAVCLFFLLIIDPRAFHKPKQLFRAVYSFTFPPPGGGGEVFQRFKVFPTLSIDFGEENQWKEGGNKSKTVKLYTPLDIIELYWLLETVFIYHN